MVTAMPKKRATRGKPAPTWAERLKGLRGDATQIDMAARLGITQGQYSKLEKGERVPLGPLALLIARLESETK